MRMLELTGPVALLRHALPCVGDALA
jgi:hypothetical protein